MEPTATPNPPPRRVLLLGAGHAHLDTIRAAGEFRAAGAELVVVAPGPFHYSGLATGVLAGELEAAAHRVDVGALAAAGGGRWVAGRAVAIELAAPSAARAPRAPRAPGNSGARGGSAVRVRLDDGRTLEGDYLSLNLGSETAAHGSAFRAKPLESLVRLGDELEQLARERRGHEPPHLVVVGAGASGCELALCGERRMASVGHGRVTLVAGGGEVLGRDFSPRARRRMLRALLRRGVAVEFGRAIDLDGAESGEELHLEGGGTLRFDRLLLATGQRTAPCIAASGLRTVDGALHVDRHLRSVDNPRVFAGGDCASFEGTALPRIGVHAVRQGPVLRDNLLAALRGDPPSSYRPQQRALLILNLGDRTGLATRGGLVCEGRWAWRLKRWIDRRFLRRFELPSARRGR